MYRVCSLHTLEDVPGVRRSARTHRARRAGAQPLRTLAHDTYHREARTSRTAFLRDLRSGVVDAIDARICSALGINATYSEASRSSTTRLASIQAARDYFEPAPNTYERHAGVRGNRTWTFMVYLNEGMQGGATRFTEIDYSPARQNRAWRCSGTTCMTDGSPNAATKHCGEPVTSGRKVIITKWFRGFGDGPVLYD